MFKNMVAAIARALGTKIVHEPRQPANKRNGGKQSGAAALKRAAKKRNNIRKNSKKK